MHPLLGNFISNSFYKKDGEEFRSPRSSKEFPQPLYNVPLVWIEFNQTENEKTREKKVGTTRIRECEANYIVEEIFRMILNEGKNLSYGVITFYRGQVENIKRKLNKIKKNMNLSKEIEEKIEYYNLSNSFKVFPLRKALISSIGFLLKNISIS